MARTFTKNLSNRLVLGDGALGGLGGEPEISFHLWARINGFTTAAATDNA
jgi:hypothetical protein